MLRATLHLALHFIAPALTAKWLAKVGQTDSWAKAWLVMMLTMAVDLDHLLADPLYAPNRCSIGFHPLHTQWPILIYLGLCLHPKTRLVGLGLVIHMLLDGLDCWMMMD